MANAHAVHNKTETTSLLRREIAAGAASVIVGGGDGTLSECAAHLVHTPVAMGVLPMGTGNTLARSLGIPIDLNEAAKIIVEGHAQAIDVGRVNGRVFLNSVTLGFSAEIAKALDADVKRKLGLFSWPYIGTKVFLSHRPTVLRVTAPGHRFHVRTHQFVVANGRYIAGPITATPDASIQDAAFDVFALGGADKGSMVGSVLHWLSGRHVRAAEERYFRASKLRVQSLRRPVPADVDGEISEQTPLELEIDEKALRILVPHGFDAKLV